MSSEADDLAARLERIKRLTAEYLNIKARSVEASQLAKRISAEVDAARKQLNRPQPRR